MMLTPPKKQQLQFLFFCLSRNTSPKSLMKIGEKKIVNEDQNETLLSIMNMKAQNVITEIPPSLFFFFQQSVHALLF